MTAGRLRGDDGFGGGGDAFYEALLRAHAGLGDAEAASLDSRLVLILANEVGDLAVLLEALAVARASLGLPDEDGAPRPATGRITPR